MYGFEEIFTRLANGKTLRSDELMQVASLVVLLWVGGAALVYALFIVGGGQSKQHCKEAEEELARLAERAKKQLAEKKQPKNGASKKQERQDDNLSDAAAKPSESRVSLFLGQLKHSDHDPSILLKCLERIIEYPDETKYQSINLSSKAFQENVWQKPSAKAVLIALGFKRTKTHAVLSSPGESLPFVESAAIFLKQMIEQKVAEQQVAAAAASQDTGGALPNIWGSGEAAMDGEISMTCTHSLLISMVLMQEGLKAGGREEMGIGVAKLTDGIVSACAMQRDGQTVGVEEGAGEPRHPRARTAVGRSVR
jgi:hypothetical protein